MKSFQQTFLFSLLLIATLLITACAQTPDAGDIDVDSLQPIDDPETLRQEGIDLNEYYDATEEEVALFHEEYYGADFDITEITDFEDYEKEIVGDVTIIKDVPYGDDINFRFDIYYEGVLEDVQESPIVFVVHGGDSNAGRKSNMRDRSLLYAEEGYVVVSPDFKWGFRLYSVGISSAHTTACAVASFKELAEVHGIQTDTVVLHGYSFGGYITSLVAYNQEEDWLANCPVQDDDLSFAAYIGESTNFGNTIPSEYTETIEIGPEGLNILGPQELIDEIDIYEDIRGPRLGAMNYLDANDPPAQFFHGTADPKFNEQRALDFEAALEEIGIEANSFIEEGSGHSIGISQGSNDQAIETMFDFVAEKTS